MLNYLYIDNFKCFTNFEWKPDSLSLLLGNNGAGKTSIFDVVETIRDFVVNGTDTETAFPFSKTTAWDQRFKQTFELGFMGSYGECRYRLVIEWSGETFENRIGLEEVTRDGRLLYLYRFEDEKAYLADESESEGTSFPANAFRSPLAGLPVGRLSPALRWFVHRLRDIYVISPVPSTMSDLSEKEVSCPDRNLVQYASWLRHLANDLRFPGRLMDALAPVIEGLENMEFYSPRLEKPKELQFVFDFAGEDRGRGFRMPLSNLSEGQRCLVALYTALIAIQDRECSLLWDEPDNYVSLREIQPWLEEIRKVVEKQGRQCLLISHHPELINALAAEHGTLIYRDKGGPARTKPFEWTKGEMSPAEIVAAGWEV